MKAPMSKTIAGLIKNSNAANKIVDAVLKERAKPGIQAIEIGTGGDVVRYKPIGFRSKDLK